MTKIKHLLPILCLLCLLAGCIHTPQSEWQTDYPALESGIGLTQFQIDLQQEYDELYEFVNSEQQEYLKNEVKPILQRSQNMISAYNEAVLNGSLPPHSEREIRRLLRRVSQKLLETEK